jgi:hypothetical protein
MSSDKMDKLGYEMLAKDKPEIVEAIQDALVRGVSPDQIEQFLRCNFGEKNANINMAIHAAYYMASTMDSLESV